MEETRNFNPGPEEAAKSQGPVKETTIVKEEAPVLSEKVIETETPAALTERTTTEKYVATESLEDVPSKG